LTTEGNTLDSYKVTLAGQVTSSLCSVLSMCFHTDVAAFNIYERQLLWALHKNCWQSQSDYNLKLV